MRYLRYSISSSYVVGEGASSIILILMDLEISRCLVVLGDRALMNGFLENSSFAMVLDSYSSSLLLSCWLINVNY